MNCFRRWEFLIPEVSGMRCFCHGDFDGGWNVLAYRSTEDARGIGALESDKIIYLKSKCMVDSVKQRIEGCKG